MNVALRFTRVFFLILCPLFMSAYVASNSDTFSLPQLGLGLLLGVTLSGLLIGFDLLFKRFNLRAYNIVIVGLFTGYLMGQALVTILSAVLDISSGSAHLDPKVVEAMKISLLLFGTYLGTLMTLRAADEFYVSIPFVKFTPTAHKKKDLLADISVLSDARIIDLATSGLIDHHLVVPRYLVKDLYAQAESLDEMIRTKARRSLEVVKKLESMPGLDMRYNDTDFPEVKDSMSKLVRLARLVDANILTADFSRLQISSIEGVKVINIHSLSNSLKPLMQAGENIKIKIQRLGKEPRQGVGYLEDGTMVVVNGGGQFILNTIDAQVLSVKHTSSGRMIFCNALDGNGNYQEEERDSRSPVASGRHHYSDDHEEQ